LAPGFCNPKTKKLYLDIKGCLELNCGVENG